MIARELDRSRNSPHSLRIVLRRGDAQGEASRGDPRFRPRFIVVLRGLLTAEADAIGPRRVLGIARVLVAATTLTCGCVHAASAAGVLSRLGARTTRRRLRATKRGNGRCRCHRDGEQNQEADAHLFSIVRQDQAEGPMPFSAVEAASLERPEARAGPASAPGAPFVPPHGPAQRPLPGTRPRPEISRSALLPDDTALGESAPLPSVARRSEPPLQSGIRRVSVDRHEHRRRMYIPTIWIDTEQHNSLRLRVAVQPHRHAPGFPLAGVRSLEHQPVSASTTFRSRTGKRRHRAACWYLRRSMIAIARRDAVAQGFVP